MVEGGSRHGDDRHGADAPPPVSAPSPGDATPADAGFGNPYAAPVARVSPVVAEEERPVRSPPRPWIRYWARTLDIYLVALALGIGVGIAWPDALANRGAEQLFGMAVILFWVFVETALLATVGTTPGKWLLNVRLSAADGLRLTPAAALSRSLRVWWRGLGTGFPLAALITQLVAHRRLTRDGITSWDRDGGFVVVHGPVGWVRGLATALFFAAFVALIVLGSVAG